MEGKRSFIRDFSPGRVLDELIVDIENVLMLEEIMREYREFWYESPEEAYFGEICRLAYGIPDYMEYLRKFKDRETNREIAKMYSLLITKLQELEERLDRFDVGIDTVICAYEIHMNAVSLFKKLKKLGRLEG